MTERSPAVEIIAATSTAERPPPPPESPLAPNATPAIAPGTAPSGAEVEVDAASAPVTHDSAWYDVWLQAPSWLTSIAVHLTLVIGLGLITTARMIGVSADNVSVSVDASGASGKLEELSGELLSGQEQLDLSPPVSPPQISDLASSAPLAATIGLMSGTELAKTSLELKPLGGGTVPGGEEGGIGGGQGNGLELRLSGTSREGMWRSGGGSKASEKAVELSLRWLAEHQNYDGSWTFEHQKSPKCHGACGNPGVIPGQAAATSLALLPFLGTGQTHREGQYKKNIDLGLKFLVRSMQVKGDLGSLHEGGGTMYGHGLASIALCEAYGMTHDPALKEPAQLALNFIVYAQDPEGGGWRYMVQQSGDTSVVGWQMMALKSGQMAELKVPQITLRKAGYFLDSVQSDRGATYGYQSPDRTRAATTAIGLLCRMYLGWKHEHRPLQQGVQILGTLGPSTDKTNIRNNMYYNYYATQVMHHYGGYPWQRWNEVMREYLIGSQSQRGHEKGSWFLDGSDHGAMAGGRLYCTAMAAMTLEVYYRYMPLYRDNIIQ